jgi:heme O synthase-like polyprenyltransferase
MHAHPSRTLMASFVGAVLVLAGIGVVWALVPDAAGGLLLAGFALATIIYLAIYALERRRHW